ncbi:MAG TPA: ATP-binding cassette domain-containing protein [Bacilli bacterium]|nr:ATP-binding cassette domain-containing protein [Bacilli bacterium]
MEIKFNNVSYAYNNNTPIKVEALKDINLNFIEGKLTSLIGRSGSGKTTIAELCNALLFPQNGKIGIGSYTLTSKGVNKKDVNKLRVNVGLVFQFPEEQFFNMTVKEEISFGMKYFKYKTNKIDTRTSEALKMVGLDDTYLERNPFTLSSGEKRKVAIASILAFNPDVIILDEPTIGLDSESKKNLIQLIRKLKTRLNRTIILISHDMEIVHAISDYIYVLDKGKIVLEGDKYFVFKQEDELKEYGIRVPKIMEFSNKVLKEKGIKIGYRDDINDLIKDIYRYVK